MEDFREMMGAFVLEMMEDLETKEAFVGMEDQGLPNGIKPNQRQL